MSHPIISDETANYYFLIPGKHFFLLLVFIVSHHLQHLDVYRLDIIWFILA